ncbi:hypothetical protein DF013_17500 [Burkholderia ubonensis]|nr:hypothetical protein DF013_17500 [Burkholderia ubonensis]
MLTAAEFGCFLRQWSSLRWTNWASQYGRFVSTKVSACINVTCIADGISRYSQDFWMCSRASVRYFLTPVASNSLSINASGLV